MATKRRSWEAMLDSDDEDEPILGRQTLPVANLPGDFDGEPMDGFEYLFMVRRDAKRLPFYTRVQNPYRNAPTKPQIEQAPIVSKPRVVLPSEEWRDVFVKRFRNFRKNSAQPTIGVELPSLPLQWRSRLMPDRKERDNWWAFINGRPEAEWNPPKRPKKPRGRFMQQPREGFQSSTSNIEQYEVHISEDLEVDGGEAREILVMNEFGEVTEEQVVEGGVLDGNGTGATEGASSLPTPFSTPQPEERFKLSEWRGGGPRNPTPALLKVMDSRYCMHLLMYFTYWITQHLGHLESGQASTSPFSHLSQNHARWMFALLSRVDEQLTSDELSTLRNLARACIAFIKDLNKNNSAEILDSDSPVRVGGNNGLCWVGDPADAPLDERACWMIVAIITDFWGQKDLWMDAESALNGH